MRTEKQIRALQRLMRERWETGSNKDVVALIMPADAYNISEALEWVLGEHTGIDELLNRLGLEV